MFGRRKAAVLLAEFMGTGVLTLLYLSVQRSTIGLPFFVALAAGLTMALLMLALGMTSGAHLNPAITLAMWTARKIATLHAVVYIAMQLLGAWGAYYLYTYFVGSKLQPIGGHYVAKTLVAEGVGALVLGFAWAAAVYQKMNLGTKAAVVGLAYMLAIVAASTASIGMINPALALGVRAWVPGTYVLGPVLGAVVGVNLYGLLFAEPETAAAAAVATSGASARTATTSAAATRPVATRGRAAAKKPAAKRKTATRSKK